MTAPIRIPEVRTDVVFVFDLVRQLKEGRVRIPRFQRPFVWSNRQMVDLLDSINKQYPIGNLLTWKTDERVHSLSRIGPVEIDTEVAGASSVYVIDGHQRLSTIAGALVSDDRIPGGEDADRWRIFYNALDDIFEHVSLDVEPAPYYFPMTKLLETFDFLEESQRVLAAEPQKGRMYLDRIQGVARAFQNYRVPVIQINDTGITEAVEIFARLNSRGQAMTADQMVSALLYDQESGDTFDLAGEIDVLMDALATYGFGDLDRTVVLRALLAAIGEDIYRTDWTRLASERRQQFAGRLTPVIPKVKQSLEIAAKFLNDELGVANDRLLPYAMQITVLSSFFFSQHDPSEAQLNLLKRWFWTSSFGAWFGGANPSRVNALVRDVMDKVAAERENPKFRSIDLERPALPIPRSFDMRSARTRVHLLTVLDLQPSGPRNEPIENPQGIVHAYGPEALGYVINFDSVKDKEIARSPANRIIRYSPTVRGQARTWLLDDELGSNPAIWESNAMPVDSRELLTVTDGSEFLRARLALLSKIERDFMHERGVVLPATDGTVSA